THLILHSYPTRRSSDLVRVDAATGISSARPVGERVEPCEGAPLSTPILAQDGRRVAVRDERSGTTKIVRLEEGGRCTELLDLGIDRKSTRLNSSHVKTS